MRVMVSAHIDEIGLMVTHVDDNGFARFLAVGGVSPLHLHGQPGHLYERRAWCDWHGTP